MADLALARQLRDHPRRAGWPAGTLLLEQATPGMGLWRGGCARVTEQWPCDDDRAIPDLTDDATAGVLLGWLHAAVLPTGAELSAAWELATDSRAARWCIEVCWCGALGECPPTDLATYGATLGEAVAGALLAVWEVE